jgi:hypothetical protein
VREPGDQVHCRYRLYEPRKIMHILVGCMLPQVLCGRKVISFAVRVPTCMRSSGVCMVSVFASLSVLGICMCYFLGVLE